jgi:hypothetical protein
MQHIVNIGRTSKLKNVILVIDRIVNGLVDYKIAIDVNGGDNELNFGVNISLSKSVETKWK